MVKKNDNKELLEISKRQLYVQKQHLKVSKEHKNISKQNCNLIQRFVNGTMTKTEQRLWYSITILITLLVGLIGGAIFFKLPFSNNNKTLDYDIDVQVNPSKIILNQNGYIFFTFTITNTGNKNISNFMVSRIDLYRKIEKDKNIYLQNMIDISYGVTDCYGLEYSQSSSGGNLPVGKSCNINAKLLSYSQYFDDKNKTPQFYIYFTSNPPISNKIVNLTIY